MKVRKDPDLLERDAELLDIGAMLDGAREGRGGMVVVEGAAGAGKSTLVAAARRRAARDGLRVLGASGSEFEREYAFGAIRQLFEPLLEAVGRDERSRLLSGAAEPARWALSSDGDASRADAGFAVLNAVYWLAANLSSEQPLLIAVDDLHWVDEASVRSLSHLGRRVGDVPIALVVALRPEEPGAPAALLDEVHSLPGAVRVAPRPLSAGAVAAVVRAHSAEAGDELCAAFHAASGGNPLYLRELLRTIEADGGLGGRNAIGSVERASVPSLADRVGRRIARLSSRAPGLARAMAVLGDGAPLQAAAAIAGLAEDEAATIAQELVAIEVLAGDDPFAFVHPLVRRSVYDGVSVTERDVLHAAAARELEARGAPVDAVAVHLVAVRPTGSEAVATALLRAARAARARAAPETSIRLLRRALDERAPAPPRSELLLELGNCEILVRDIAAVETLREALDLEADPLIRARTAGTIAEILSHAGRWDEMMAILETTRREIGEDAPDEAVVEIEAVRAASVAWTPALVPAFDRDRARFERLAQGSSWAAAALATQIATVLAYRGEDVDKARELIERVTREGVLIGGRGGGAWAGPILATSAWALDDLDRTLAIGAEIAEAGRRTGAIVAIIGGPLYQGLVKARRGDLVGAEADLRVVVDGAMASSMTMWLLSTVHVLADVLVERPGFDDLRETLETLPMEPAFLDSLSGATLLEPRGRLRVARGEREAGADDLRQAVTTIRALKIGPGFARCRSELALALPASEREEALELAEEELAIARRAKLPRAEGVALRALGLVTGGDEGIALLRESVAALDGSVGQLDHARALVDLGAALRRAKLRAEARVHLAAGADLAHRCGAVMLADRVEEELRAAGARPRRRARSGTESLTASERRVAELAAGGRTNVEIAQELFVSAKTVETHLSSVYRKLDLAGQGARAQLAEKLTS